MTLFKKPLATEQKPTEMPSATMVAVHTQDSDGNWAIGYVEKSSLVSKTGNETIEGIKTFTSSPIVPNATSASHAVRKDQLDKAIININSYSIEEVLTGATDNGRDIYRATYTGALTDFSLVIPIVEIGKVFYSQGHFTTSNRVKPFPDYAILEVTSSYTISKEVEYAFDMTNQELIVTSQTRKFNIGSDVVLEAIEIDFMITVEFTKSIV